jgi:hypothetical protein
MIFPMLYRAHTRKCLRGFLDEALNELHLMRVVRKTGEWMQAVTIMEFSEH